MRHRNLEKRFSNSRAHGEEGEHALACRKGKRQPGREKGRGAEGGRWRTGVHHRS